MKIFLIILFFCLELFSREIGQTEITTDEGIEVFQNEKYYLLKKNVIIDSDNFQLMGQNVKAFFKKDLYDITNIESYGNVSLKSNKGLHAQGEQINFSIIDESITVEGNQSSLVYNNINMYSNEIIKVNNINGHFSLSGEDSKLVTDEIEIYGNIINGIFKNINGINEIESLYVEDEEEANIITNSMNLFALKAKYNKQINTIELFENVKVIRNSETITGDYANINTLSETYKIKSNNNQKVKALITDTDE